MKLTPFSLTLLLVWHSLTGAPNVANAQVRPSRKPPDSARRLPPEAPRRPRPQTALETLEDSFAQIDAYAQTVESTADISVSGNEESSATLTINLESPRNAATEKSINAFEKHTYAFDLSILTIPDNFITQLIVAIFSRQSGTGSLDGVKVKQVGATGQYEVVEDYTYQATGYRITVPKGFVYDRASIPRVFWAVIDKDSLSNVAPLFHDLLYRYAGRLPQDRISPYRTFSREDADKLFLELMTKCGVIPWRRKAAYEVVRKLAASHWNDQ